MKRYLFRVFYIGRNYFGFQRQLNGATIENHLEMAFIKTGLIHSFNGSSYRATSRTDTGVNSLGNTFVLDLLVVPKLERLNDNLPNDIILLSFAEVSVIFNPRHNLSKTYSYYLSKKLEIFSLDRIVDFVGTHNFSQFIKADGAGADNPVNTIFDTTIQESSTYYRIIITGNRFGREQIRRMIGFFLQKKYKERSIPFFFNNTANYDIRSAPPTFLVLDQITFDKPIFWISSSHLGHIYQKITKKFEYDQHHDQVSLHMLKDILTQVD